MPRVERTVTSHLLIQEMCHELHMTEEQLLIHLAVEHHERWLSPEIIKDLIRSAGVYHSRGVYMVEWDRG